MPKYRIVVLVQEFKPVIHGTAVYPAIYQNTEVHQTILESDDLEQLHGWFGALVSYGEAFIKLILSLRGSGYV